MKKSALKTGLIYAFCGFLLYLSIHYWTHIGDFFSGLFSAALPLFVGFMIAYIVNIILSFYERHLFRKTTKKWLKKLRRPISITLSVLSLIAVIALVI
ncbi:MAG: AI-2E family transporter, partial [Clostridia bacterium]|nr:AI-2E family transporter [Clostridia bacterium]